MSALRSENGRGIRRPNADALRYYVRLARVKRWLVTNYAEKVSVRAAAEVAGLSEKYFSRFFLAKTGVRFSDWVHTVRLDAAIDLLEKRNHSITAIAYLVGYDDLRTFQRAFKRYTHVTPRAYRAAVRPAARVRPGFPCRAAEPRLEP